MTPDLLITVGTQLLTIGAVYGSIRTDLKALKGDVSAVKSKVFNGLSDNISKTTERVARIEGMLAEKNSDALEHH